MNLDHTDFPNVLARNPELATALAKDIGALLAKLTVPAPPPKEKSESAKHAEMLRNYGAKAAVALNDYPYKAICAQQVAEMIGVPYETIPVKTWASIMKHAGLIRLGYSITTKYALNSYIYCRRCDLIELSVPDIVTRRSFLAPGIYMEGRHTKPEIDTAPSV